MVVALSGVPGHLRYTSTCVLFAAGYVLAAQIGFLLRARYGDVTPL